MINRNPPELFAQPPVRSDWGRGRGGPPRVPRRLLMLLALLVGLAGGLFAYFMFGSESDQQPTEIPVIKAEGPSKQRPEQPGGIDIPHQNETVFQQIDSGNGAKPPSVERLLPPPPVPQEATAPPAPAPTTAAQAPAPAAAPAPSVTTATPTTPSAQPEKLEPPSSVTPTTVSPAPAASTNVAPATPPAPAAAPSAGSKEPAKPTETGSIPKEMFTDGEPPAKGFLVQLGSFPDKLKAQTEMSKLQKKYADTLGKVDLRLTRANLGAKGVYYRIQGGPLSDAQARSVCATLWSQKAPCIIVRP